MAGGSLSPEELPPLIYTREVLGEGLVQMAELGTNPFKFGLIGATDTHLGAPGLVDEDRFQGHAAGTVDARFEIPAYPDRPDFNPGGLGVFWAEENSRDALFAAMRRREAYGTSGPRMTVRFFGGWDYPEDLCRDPAFVETGYSRGVPMGGDLPRKNQEGSPRFAVSALRDPGGQGAPSHPLERIQIIKGWLEDGEAHEKIYDVAGQRNAEDSVDLDSCLSRATGSDQLCQVWQDPDFQSEQAAFYYARVLEVPSCRWNQYVCNDQGVDCDNPDSVPESLQQCCNPEIPKTIRERAWTSPIWYTPGSDKAASGSELTQSAP